MSETGSNFIDFMAERPGAKTHQGWQSSKKPLDEYLQIGDTVDDDLLAYMMDIVPPLAFEEHGLCQVGEASGSIKLKGTPFNVNTYATFTRVDGSFANDQIIYCGNCIPRSLYPHASDLTTLRPELKAGIAGLETSSAPAYKDAARIWQTQNVQGNLWRVCQDWTHAEQGEATITKAYLPDKSGFGGQTIMSIELTEDKTYAVTLYGPGPLQPSGLQGFKAFKDAHAAAMGEVAAHLGYRDKFVASGYRFSSSTEQEKTSTKDVLASATAIPIQQGVKEVSVRETPASKTYSQEPAQKPRQKSPAAAKSNAELAASARNGQSQNRSSRANPTI